MDRSTYILFFYSIIIGLTTTSYLKGWTELIANREKAKNWIVSFIWSLSFLIMIMHEWFAQYSLWKTREVIFDLIQIMALPFGLFVISELIFPKMNTEDCDYFKHLLKHKKIIFGIIVLLLLFKFDFTSPIDEHLRTRKEILFIIVPSFLPVVSSKRNVILISGVWFLSFWIYRILLLSHFV